MSQAKKFQKNAPASIVEDVVEFTARPEVQGDLALHYWGEGFTQGDATDEDLLAAAKERGINIEAGEDGDYDFQPLLDAYDRDLDAAIERALAKRYTDVDEAIDAFAFTAGWQNERHQHEGLDFLGLPGYKELEQQHAAQYKEDGSYAITHDCNGRTVVTNCEYNEETESVMWVEIADVAGCDLVCKEVPRGANEKIDSQVLADAFKERELDEEDYAIWKGATIKEFMADTVYYFKPSK